MDLTDILFSKPFIGSGGGGGDSNVETATIVITITDGTPTITSGAFPDWCTAANSDYIYGGLDTHNMYVGKVDFDDVRLGENIIYYEESETIIGFSSNGNEAELSTDLTILVIDGEEITSGTLTVTLIYMPEE